MWERKHELAYANSPRLPSNATDAGMRGNCIDGKATDVINSEGAVALDNGLLLATVKQNPEELTRLEPHQLLIRELAAPTFDQDSVDDFRDWRFNTGHGTDVVCACCVAQSTVSCACVQHTNTWIPEL